MWVLQADMSPGGKPRNDREFWGSVLGSDAIEQHDQQVSPCYTTAEGPEAALTDVSGCLLDLS